MLKRERESEANDQQVLNLFLGGGQKVLDYFLSMTGSMTGSITGSVTGSVTAFSGPYGRIARFLA